jgi:predicted nucleotidyltransferase
MRKLDVIRRIKDHKDEILALKVGSLYVYGSTARDEATPTSDVDVFIDPAPGFTFVELVDLRDRLAEICETNVDFTTRKGLHPMLRARIEAAAERVL